MLTIKQQSSVCLKKGWCNIINHRPLLHHMFKFAPYDGYFDVVLACNKFTPRFILLKIAENDNFTAFVNVISRKDLSLQFIEKLYDIYKQKPKSTIIEGMFTENKNTPAFVLQELFHTGNQSVKKSCIKNLAMRSMEVEQIVDT